MKKLLLSTLALVSLLCAQNSNDPFEQMDKIFQMQLKQMELMQKQMDSMFNNFSNTKIGNMAPTIISSNSIMSSGIEDKGEYYEVKVNVGKGDIKADVKAKDSLLSIKIEQKQEKKETNSSFGTIQSYSSSSFMQSFTLPKDANSNKISYDIKDGKMVIKIEKIKK
jgi:HSP20 family molecular chaperone IbpA